MPTLDQRRGQSAQRAAPERRRRRRRRETARVQQDLATLLSTRPSTTVKRKSVAQSRQRERRQAERRLRQDVQRERAQARKGRGTKADTGDVLRNVRRDVHVGSAGVGVSGRPHPKSRSPLQRLLDIGGDTAAFLYPRGKGEGKPRTATIGAGLGTPLQRTSLVVRVPTNVARAFAEDPTSTSVATAKSGRDAIVGIPASILSAITDPVGEAKSIVKDYKRRYGAQTDRQMIDRMKKEGVLGEFLDATIIAAGPGSVAGRAASATARKGALGPTALRAVTEPRRKVRTSGGIVREQETAPTLLKAMRQKRRDEAAYRGQERAAARGPVRPEVLEALERGDVVPSRRSGVRVRQTPKGPVLEFARTPSDRKLDWRHSRGYAQDKGRTLHAMRREQRTEVGGAKRNLASLGKHERAAFKTAIQLGATTPQAARAVIRDRLDLIETQRAKGNVEILDTDEVPALQALLKEPERAFTARLAAVVAEERTRGQRVAAGDPGVAPMQALLRVAKPQAEALGIRRRPEESAANFLARANRAVRESGAEPAGFFPSRKRERAQYSAFAAGGTKAVARDKTYSGALFRTGREDASETTYLQGIAQNVKRKHNWNLVADTFEKNTFAWGRDKTLGELEDSLIRRGIDPSTVAFWNPRRYREARQQWEERGTPGEERAGGEEPVAAGVGEAVRQSTLDARGLATAPEDFRNTKGWAIIPKAVHDEIHRDTSPSGVFGRGLDVVKGKQARIMLGLSPAWLQFQVASNMLLAGLSGTGPVDLLRANLAWWRKLSDDEKAAVEPYVGMGPFSDSYEQTRLGAASNNRIVNSYRAFKANDFWHKPRKTTSGKSYRDLNPLDVLFRIDNAQNNFFRRGVLYSQVKRDAYERMGGRMRAVMRGEDSVMKILTQGPEDAMREVMRDPARLEKHARHVNDFLGDYMTYTARERRLIQRNVMFYGFLRHSLHLVFYTLPARHPLVAAVMAQLGKMTTEEVRRLLGGDELPYALGRFYRVKGKEIESVDVQRMNPALNTLTSLNKPESITGLAPPMFVALADQIYSKSSFLGRGWKVRGEPQPRPGGKDYNLEDRTRIFIEQMATLATPYRDIKDATSKGPEGQDTSLLFGRRYIEYVKPEILGDIKREQAERPDKVTERMLLRMFPMIPRKDRSREIAAEMREKNKQRKGQGKGRATSVQRQLDALGRGGGISKYLDRIESGGLR